MQARRYESLARLDMRHWWFRTRYAAVAAFLDLGLSGRPSEGVIDWGCGAGGFLAYLRDRQRYEAGRLMGFEPSSLAWPCLERRGIPFARREEDIPGTLPGGPDVVTMLDVLEHLDDPAATLRRIAALVRPGALLVLTVPAHMALWSSWDESHGHHRRYDKALLAGHLAAGGWKMERARHLFQALYPLAAIRRTRFGSRLLGLDEFPPSPPLLSVALSGWFRLERALPDPGFGASLIALARLGRAKGTPP